MNSTLLVRITHLRDQMRVMVEDLQRQRAHLETAATKLRLGADEGVVTAELRAAGAWLIDRPAQAPWTR